MRYLLFCLLAVSLLPLTQAEEQPQATLFGVEAHWMGPTQHGGLLAFRTLDSSSGSPPAFDLQASNVLAEWVESEAWVGDPNAAYHSFQPQSRFETLSQVEMAPLQNRPGWFLYVIPTSELTVTLPCGAARASNDSEISAPEMVDIARSPLGAATDTAVRVEPCADETFQLDGDMVVVVWEIDLTVTEQGTARTVETGRYGSDPDARPVLSRARQGFLTVRDGTLTVQGAGSLFFASLDLAGVPRSNRTPNARNHGEA